MSCSVYVKAVWGFKVEVQPITTQVKRFNEHTGKPYFKDQPDGQGVYLQDNVIHRCKYVSDGDQVFGLDIVEDHNCDAHYLGIITNNTEDVMYGGDHTFTPPSNPPEKVEKVGIALDLEPSLFIISNVN